MKKTFSLLLIGCALSSTAAIPPGYYNSLTGKKESALKEAAKSLGRNHTVIKYGEDTWEAFKLTDVVQVGNRLAWRDMYSNEIVWVETGHGSLNIEHSVPKSWWGGTMNEAYQDLFHLNPSNPSANNRKSNWPLGIISSVSWTNSITTLGSPSYGTGGGAKTVFEPADQYKGDFARAYFYIFTTYNDLSWDEETSWMYLPQSLTYPTLQQWSVEMLLDWAASDPVDSSELSRNEAIYALQGNRNPYIDIPDLAEFVWGKKKGTSFQASDIKEPQPIERPSAPSFGDYEITEFNTFTGRWWDSFRLELLISEGATTFYRLEGGDWIVYAPQTGIVIPEAKLSGETLTVEARSEWTVSGLNLSSPISRLVLTAKDPKVEDYKDATWRALTDGEQLESDEFYILVSEKTFNIMSTRGDASSSNKYVLTAGTVNVSDGWVTSIPEEAALLQFSSATVLDTDNIYSDAHMIVSVYDLAGNYIGSLFSSTARQMIISQDRFSPAVVTTTAQGSRIDFGEQGILQFNTSSPRFVPYTSNQEAVRLYINDPAGPPVPETVEEFTVDLNSTIRMFDLSGREIHSASPETPGLYIRIVGSKIEKIIIR